MKCGRESKRGQKRGRYERREWKEKGKLSGERINVPSVILNAVASSRERERRDGKSSAARLSIAGRHVDSGGPIKVSAFNERELRY